MVVGEKDVQSLYSMYAEVINLGQGDFTTDAVKTYLRTLEANLAPNNPQVKLANAVSGALVARYVLLRSHFPLPTFLLQTHSLYICILSTCIR